ncbi:hypothetical protein ACVIQT_007270 [Bradyrhizobium diazoefficiens]
MAQRSPEQSSARKFGGKAPKAKRKPKAKTRHPSGRSAADLRRELSRRTVELAEAREQQAATTEVLQIISSSRGDLVPVFNAMLGKAMDLCAADFGVLNTFDGELFHTAATRGLPPAYDEYRRSQPLAYGPGTAPARLLQGEPIVEILDLRESDAYRRGEPNPARAGRSRRCA